MGSKYFAKAIFVVMLAVVMLSGCATMGSKPIPAECANSVIYKNVPNADMMGSITTLAGFETFRALKKNGQSMEPVFKEMQKVVDILDAKNLTYMNFFLMVAASNKVLSQYGGIELMFVAMNADTFYNNTNHMDDCDRQYLKRNLSNTLMMMKMLQ